MNHKPEIAIVEANTLTALGLKMILEEIIPMAIIRTFHSFGELTDDTPDMYAHYFIGAPSICGAQCLFSAPEKENNCSGRRKPLSPTICRTRTEHLSIGRAVGERHSETSPTCSPRRTSG